MALRKLGSRDSLVMAREAMQKILDDKNADPEILLAATDRLVQIEEMQRAARVFTKRWPKRRDTNKKNKEKKSDPVIPSSDVINLISKLEQ